MGARGSRDVRVSRREAEEDQDHHRKCESVIDKEVQGMAVQEPEEKDDRDESADKGGDEPCREYIEIYEGRIFQELPPFKQGRTKNDRSRKEKGEPRR